MHSFAVICGWILDAIFGDPEHLPHPVRLIGSLITKAERHARSWFNNKKTAGIFVGIAVTCTVYGITFLVVSAASSISSMLGVLMSIVIIYYCLSTRCLADEAGNIMRLLDSGDIEAARDMLARIVGRDTAHLSKSEIIRATVETVGENTVDGIISPIFYACIGGPPLAMAYKAVNTLDSMIGYKNENYRDLGCFSARLDDAANYIPARLCLICVPLAAYFIKPYRAVSSLRIGIRDGHKSPSPNAGYPEACFAGALGVQLGGDCSYGGIASHKQLLGDAEHSLTTEDIRLSVKLLWLTSCITLVLFTLLAL